MGHKLRVIHTLFSACRFLLLLLVFSVFSTLSSAYTKRFSANTAKLQNNFFSERQKQSSLFRKRAEWRQHAWAIRDAKSWIPWILKWMGKTNFWIFSSSLLLSVSLALSHLFFSFFFSAGLWVWIKFDFIWIYFCSEWCLLEDGLCVYGQHASTWLVV